MKKKIVNFLAIMLTAAMLSGCGSSDVDTPLKDLKVDKYVTLGQYTGLVVPVSTRKATENEIEETVTDFYNNYVTAENGGITDRAVEMGDTANIDFVGKQDGVAFDGGTGSGVNLGIGSGSFIDGFEDGLVGVKPGETVDLNLRFPEVYPNNPALAGQPVVFTVTVNYIISPEMTDSVVANMGLEGMSTVADLRSYVEDYLNSYYEQVNDMTVKNEVLKVFVDSCEFKEIPQDMVDKYKVAVKENITQTAANYGMDAETFVTIYYNMELDAYLNQYGEQTFKQDVALQALANKENLNMTDEELETKLMEYATSAGYTTLEEFLGEDTAEEYREYLMCEDVLAFLVENASISYQ